MKPISHSLSRLVRALLCALPAGLLLDPSAQALERLPYDNPALTVDLGVGLWAWPVPCDADGDGDHDLIVVCPDKPSNGTYYFENVSGKEKLPIFKAPKRLGKGQHYATPSYIDSQVRVLTPSAEYPDFLKTGLDQPSKLPLATKNIHKVPMSANPGLFKIRHNQWRYVDFDGDTALDLVVAIEDWSDYGWDDAWDQTGRWKNGPLHGIIYVMRNTGTTKEPKYAEPALLEADGKRLDTFGCPSPNFADFDSDGDLDLLCGEFLDGFTYFENVGSRTAPRYAAGNRLTHKGKPLVMDLEMIVPVAFDWDSDGDHDLIVGDEDGRVAFVENTGELASDRTPQFLPPVYFQQQADTLKCGALATPVGADWDGDGDADIISGNTAGYIEFFENLSGPNVAEPKWAAPKRLEAGGEIFRIMAGPNGSIQGPAEAKWGYTTLNVSDWDGDGLQDVVFNSIWGRVQWLKNVGTATAPKLAVAQPIEVEWTGPAPKPEWTWWTPQGRELVTQWRTTPVVVDWDKDGLRDLVMLDPEGYLSFYQRAKRDDKLVLLPPRRAFIDEAGNPIRLNSKRAGGSGRRKLCAVDWDGDGQLDLLANSANATFLRTTEVRDDKWVLKDLGNLDKRNIEGHDVSPAVVDFDGDTIPDFLGGAEDGRFYFMKNPRSTK